MFFFSEASENLFGCKDTSSQRCVRTDAFFISRTEGPKGAKLGSKTETTAEQLGCFLRFAGAKVGT